MPDSIIETLLRGYNNFTKSERKIIDYVLANKFDAQYQSITDLSAASGVAVSTVSVFCKKLQLEGFNDFKMEIAKATIPTDHKLSGTATGEIAPNDTLEEVIEKTCNVNYDALLHTFRFLDRDSVVAAVNLLQKARQVICLGQGNHSIVANAAWARFSTVFSNFKTIQDVALQNIAVSTMEKEDVVLYFSYSGETDAIQQAGKIISARGAKMILVTRFSSSPGASMADVVLLCGSDEKPLLFGSIAAIVAQLFVVDVLYNEYRRENFEKTEKIREFVAKAISQKAE